MSREHIRRRISHQRKKPLSIADLPSRDQERFIDRIFLGSKKSQQPKYPHLGPCIEWTKGRDRGGYGVCNPAGYSTMRVSRAVCEYFNGRMGMLITTHRCDNPSCVHPAHIRPGTEKTNNNEAKDRLRTTLGEKNRHASLTEGGVREIVRRRRSGESAYLLAVEFGVKVLAIQRIMRGNTWQHLTDLDRSPTAEMKKRHKHGMLARGPNGERPNV